MKKINRKIISGALLFGCAAAVIAYAAGHSPYLENGALPVSITSSDEKPLIILDAGHGESTKVQL